MGHEVTVCADGLAAVDALSQDAFDCLLVDLNMPGLTGIEVIEEARKISPKTDSHVPLSSTWDSSSSNCEEPAASSH